MPYKSTLELYSEIILPKLQDGPKTCAGMEVPRYAAQHLKVRNVVACRMRKLYHDGRPLGAIEQYMLPDHVPPKLMDCDDGLRRDGHELVVYRPVGPTRSDGRVGTS